ncbi:MAG: DNA repair putative endonuclease MmcB [Parvularculaceae bacterium]
MQNLLFEADEAVLPPSRPAATLTITRGVTRLFGELGLAPLTEFSLPNGRRADVVGLGRDGRLAIAEIKSCQADFDADGKWEDYLPFCDIFFFAVADDFPREILPGAEGLIIADGFGGAVLREAVERPLVAARRKAVTLRFARQAAARTVFMLNGF